MGVETPEKLEDPKVLALLAIKQFLEDQETVYQEYLEVGPSNQEQFALLGPLREAQRSCKGASAVTPEIIKKLDSYLEKRDELRSKFPKLQQESAWLRQCFIQSPELFLSRSVTQTALQCSEEQKAIPYSKEQTTRDIERGMTFALDQAIYGPNEKVDTLYFNFRKKLEKGKWSPDAIAMVMATYFNQGIEADMLSKLGQACRRYFPQSFSRVGGKDAMGVQEPRQVTAEVLPDGRCRFSLPGTLFVTFDEGSDERVVVPVRCKTTVVVYKPTDQEPDPVATTTQTFGSLS